MAFFQQYAVAVRAKEGLICSCAHTKGDPDSEFPKLYLMLGASVFLITGWCSEGEQSWQADAETDKYIQSLQIV